MYGFNTQMNVDRINQQIQELERMKTGFQNIPQQQPIQNIINTNTTNIDFEARYLKENEKVEEILVQRKTAFIDLNKAKLSIKELNGDVTSYEIVLPKTKEQLRIEELEKQIEEMKKNESISNARTTTKSKESTSND